MQIISFPSKKIGPFYFRSFYRFSQLGKSSIEDDFSNYSKIRIYKEKTILQLLNHLMISNFCKSEFFVANSLAFVKGLQRLLGKKISTFLIRKTIGSIFTGGENLREMNQIAQNLKEKKNLPVVYFYSNEVQPGHEFTSVDMEKNKQEFIQSMKDSKQMNERNIVALKVSAIGSFESIKAWNICENNLIHFFKKIDSDKKGHITVKELENYIANNLKNITESDIGFFVKEILGKKLESDTIQFDEWKIKVHAIYVDDQRKTNNHLIKHFSVLSEKDYLNIKEMNQRLFEIFEIAKQINARILVDAEQTFAQKAIDVLAEQFQTIFNKNQAIIYNTMQNYLKSTKDRIIYEVKKCQMLNLPIALKMVRGAYMDEERALAKKKNEESPICDSFELTTQSFHGNIKHVLENLTPNSEILVGSHNKDTVIYVKSLIEQLKLNKTNGSIKFAQLLGLADHLTYSLNSEGYYVVKLIPYGQTQILIPYLLRRAQESKVNMSSTILQKELLKHELRQKIFLK